MRTWCDVSIDNLEHNFNQIKSKLNNNTKLCGIVKANAYGHGVEEVASNLVRLGVDYLAVAFIDEAIELRGLGFEQPILILGNTPKDTVEKVVEYNITAAVYDVETAKAISAEAQKQDKVARIHIKIDTGMGRIGFVPDEQSTLDILEISKFPNIEIEGIFTHFACSDDSDESMTIKQFESFSNLIERLEKDGLII
ncbi:MAG: alanine racemase, partial [Clostridia bacterium]|nr:alanine racemase [Clostridia bacterium]